MYDQKKVYDTPTLGMNDRLSPIMCDSKETPVLENYEVNKRGILEKTTGYTKDGSPFPNSTDSFIRMLVNLKQSATSDILIMAAQDNTNTNSTYKVDMKKTIGDGTYQYLAHTAGTSASFTGGNTAVTGVGTTWLSHLKTGDKIKAKAHADSAYTEIATVNNDTSITLVAGGYLGATAGPVDYEARILLNKFNTPRAAVFNSKAIIVNGIDTPMTYDNITLNRITDADCPKGKFVETHKSRVFMADSNSNLYWSAVNDESAWDATSFEPIFPQDNGSTCCIKSFADSMIVFKDNGNIYQVLGNFDQSAEGEVDFIRKVDLTEGIGAISGRTPIIHENFLYFFAQTGIYRMDPRGFVEKVSWSVNNFLKSVYNTVGTTQSKYYQYDSKTQWDTGVYKDTSVANLPITTRSSTDGTLSGFCDIYTETGINNLYFPHELSTFIAADGTLHYLIKNPSGYRVYVKRTIDGVETRTQLALDIDVFYHTLTVAADGSVAVFCRDSAGAMWLAEQPAGTGAFIYTDVSVEVGGGLSSCGRMCACYGGGPGYSLYLLSENEASHTIICVKRVLGAWFKNTTTIGGVHFLHNCFIDSTGNLCTAVTLSSSYLPQGCISADGGATWTQENALSANTAQTVSFTENSTGQKILLYKGATAVVSYNLVTNAETSLVTTADWFRGGIIDGYDKAIFYTSSNVGTLTLYYDNSVAIVDPTASRLSTTSYALETDFHSNRGIVSLIAAGANSGEVIITRMSPRAYWVGPESHDTTLSSWSTFDTAELNANGGTLTTQVAIKATSPPTSFAAITNGTVISSDATKIYIIPKVIMLMGTFSAPSIGSIVMNYLGLGVDAKQPIGITFENELYYGFAEGTTNNNSTVLVRDIGEKYFKVDYPVSCFERFKQKLYAGDSRKGDLLLLKQNYNFDGSAYTGECQYKEDFLGTIELEKDIGKLYVLYEVKSSGTAVISYRLDSFITDGGSTWKDTTVDMTKDGFSEILVGQKARTIQLKVTDSVLDGKSAIIAMVLTYRNLNQR